MVHGAAAPHHPGTQCSRDLEFGISFRFRFLRRYASVRAATVTPSVASPFKPRLRELLFLASATEPSLDPHAHQTYVDALIAREFVVKSATDPTIPETGLTWESIPWDASPRFERHQHL